MQVMFDGSDEPSGSPQEGLGEWPGTVAAGGGRGAPHGVVDRAPAKGSACSPVWRTSASTSSTRRADWTMEPPTGHFAASPRGTWATHGNDFVAAVENGPRRHPVPPGEVGEAGLAMLENWVKSRDGPP